MLDSSSHFEAGLQVADIEVPAAQDAALAPASTGAQRAGRAAGMVVLWGIGLAFGAFVGFIIALMTGLLMVC